VQRAHARNNNSADTSVSAGDATGHRSSGGAARVLCFFLRHNRDALQLRRRRVVELGCGLGVAGLYAARTAAAVTLTDGDERALALARLSYALSASVLVAPVRFAPLTWSAEAALAPLFAGDAAGGDCQADDGAAACALLPPLLLGADLLYYSDGVVALLETVAALLAAGPPGGLAVLASNPRYADWAADACAAAARLGLQPHALPIEAVVPPAELAHGWFQNTRLVRDAASDVSSASSAPCAALRWRGGGAACCWSAPRQRSSIARGAVLQPGAAPAVQRVLTRPCSRAQPSCLCPPHHTSCCSGARASRRRRSRPATRRSCCRCRSQRGCSRVLWRRAAGPPSGRMTWSRCDAAAARAMNAPPRYMVGESASPPCAAPGGARNCEFER
jgi:hypothetical protein